MARSQGSKKLPMRSLCGSSGILYLLSIIMTLALRGCLWAHTCGWRQIALTYKCVMMPCGSERCGWLISQISEEACAFILHSGVLAGARELAGDQIGEQNRKEIRHRHDTQLLCLFFLFEKSRIRYTSPGMTPGTRFCCVWACTPQNNRPNLIQYKPHRVLKISCFI